MTWTRWIGVTAMLGLLSGCVYGYRNAAYEARYSRSSRPQAEYFCYDCHGYRYFDPYYDWCEYYGFRFGWSEHPGAVAVYRQRYVRIKENHPEYGRYRYRSGYRGDSRYREAQDYEAWRDRPPRTEVNDRREDRGRGRPDHPGPARREKSKDAKDKHRGGERSHERSPGGVTR